MPFDEVIVDDLYMEGVFSCMACIPDDWKVVWEGAWNSVYGSLYPASSNPWVFRIELIFHPVNRRREVFNGVAGAGEGSHICFIGHDGKENEIDYISYTDHTPAEAEERARELADALGAVYCGWLG